MSPRLEVLGELRGERIDGDHLITRHQLRNSALEELRGAHGLHDSADLAAALGILLRRALQELHRGGVVRPAPIVVREELERPPIGSGGLEAQAAQTAAPRLVVLDLGLGLPIRWDQQGRRGDGLLEAVLVDDRGLLHPKVACAVRRLPLRGRCIRGGPRTEGGQQDESRERFADFHGGSPGGRAYLAEKGTEGQTAAGAAGSIGDSHFAVERA